MEYNGTVFMPSNFYKTNHPAEFLTQWMERIGSEFNYKVICSGVLDINKIEGNTLFTIKVPQSVGVIPNVDKIPEHINFICYIQDMRVRSPEFIKEYNSIFGRADKILYSYKESFDSFLNRFSDKGEWFPTFAMPSEDYFSIPIDFSKRINKCLVTGSTQLPFYKLRNRAINSDTGLFITLKHPGYTNFVREQINSFVGNKYIEKLGSYTCGLTSLMNDGTVGGSHPTICPDDYPKGVEVYRGEFETTGCRLSDLSTLPESNYDILLDDYSPNGYAHLVTSRGCPFNCSFCSSALLWDRKVTFKEIDGVLSEMSYIKNRFGSDYFTFWDETFTINKKRLYEFCNKYNIDAKWRCDTRADSISDEMIRVMKNSNCGQMSIGIESGNDDILRLINKGETVDDSRKAADLLNKHNMQWKAYCIIGFPYETDQDMYNTIEFVKSLHPFRITLSYFTPYKGTDLYRVCKSKGLIDDSLDYAYFSHQSKYNYFCDKVSREQFQQIKKDISKQVDDYNTEAIKVWK